MLARLLLLVVFLQAPERLLNVLRCRMHVARGDPNIAVAGDLLNREGVSFGFREPSEGGVPEVVESKPSFQLNLLHEAVMLRVDGGIRV